MPASSWGNIDEATQLETADNLATLGWTGTPLQMIDKWRPGAGFTDQSVVSMNEVNAIRSQAQALADAGATVSGGGSSLLAIGVGVGLLGAGIYLSRRKKKKKGR